MSDMRLKGFRISEAVCWEDIIACCQNLARCGDRLLMSEYLGAELEFSMRERNGKMLLHCSPKFPRSIVN